MNDVITNHIEENDETENGKKKTYDASKLQRQHAESGHHVYRKIHQLPKV